MQISLDELDVAPSHRLGLAFPSGDLETYEALAEAGFGKVRLGVSWDRIQPSPWTWNFAGLDAQITVLNALGIEPLLTFYSDAAWATREGDNRSLNDIPLVTSWWDRFVGETAGRYADFVDVYQVANEFAGIDNESGGWGGTADQLVAYVNTAYGAVKAADPGATFVMGGVASFVADIALVNLRYATFEPHQPFSETSETRFTVADTRSAAMTDLLDARLFAPLRNALYDQASVHLYGDRSRDALRIEMMQDLTEREVITTESGAPTFDGTNRASPTELFTASVMADLGALAAGAQTVYWFQDYSDGTTFYNQQVPLRDADGAPKPSFWAKKLLATYLADDATVAAANDGAFLVESAQNGQALIGFASSVTEALREAAFDVSDVWLLEDPATGLLRLWNDGDAVAPDAFAVVDTGWLRAAAAAPVAAPEGVLDRSVTITFVESVEERTKIDMLRDGEIVDQFWYTGEQTMGTADLKELGIELSTAASVASRLGLGHGTLGVATRGEPSAAHAAISRDERLALELAATPREDDRPVLYFQALGVDAGETVTVTAYRSGVRVAAEEAALTTERMWFDAGLDFERVEIAAGANSAFSLQSIGIDWYL